MSKKFEAKTAIAWVKSRWSLVVFLVVALLLVPAMVYFALGMQSAKQAKFAKQVSDDAAEFQTPVLNYTVPQMLPGQAGIEWTAAPNEEAIKQAAAARTRQMEASSSLVNEAVAFNKGARRPLIDNVLPSPPANDFTLAKQFRRVLVGDATQQLLALIRAGGPIPSSQLAQVLQDYQTNFLQNQLGTDAKEGVDRLSEEKRRELDKAMVDQRIKQYTLWAQKIGVYAGREAFVGLPVINEAVTPGMTELWEWQVDYWTIQDVFTAVAKANEPGRDRGVTASAVKRISRVAVSGAPVPAQTGGTPDPAAVPAATGDGSSDYTKSITGRRTNPLYDVRTVTLECVVATKHLPRFFDALAQTNLMTVTGVTLSKVDIPADLRDGYFYGDDHVSRAVIAIETVWLREWTKDLMPKEVKVALGMEAGDPAAAPLQDGSQPAPQPAPPQGGRAMPIGKGGSAGG